MHRAPTPAPDSEPFEGDDPVPAEIPQRDPTPHQEPVPPQNPSVQATCRRAKHYWRSG